jgi:CheY-like chemotaxis protein
MSLLRQFPHQRMLASARSNHQEFHRSRELTKNSGIQKGLFRLNLCREHRGQVRAVLLDMTMPRLNGFETLGLLRQVDADLPVLLTSGYSEAELTRQFGRLRLAGFVQKPYGLTDLLQKLKTALD